MSETRKKLSAVQLARLTDAERLLNEKTAAARLAKDHLNSIIELVLDAHEIKPSSNIQFDAAAGEIVITELPTTP